MTHNASLDCRTKAKGPVVTVMEGSYARPLNGFHSLYAGTAAALPLMQESTITDATSKDRKVALTEIASRRVFRLTQLRHGFTVLSERIRPRETAMTWKTPVIIEIVVGLEINAYACADVK
jgi:coenzyme PQQ precursor peptide PqqA